MIFYLISYITCGITAGLLAGLLGIGGGIVIIPMLITLFSMQKMPTEIMMHMAAATSLATVILTGTSSAYSHYRHGAVIFPLAKKFLPGIVIGSAIGVLLATRLSSIGLQKLFGIFMLFLCYQHWVSKPQTQAHDILPQRPILFSIATLIGTLSTMLGLGGGALIVPYFTRYNVPIRQAVATAAVCLLPVAVIGSVGYMLLDHEATPIAWSTGYIYWPAVLGVGIPSFLCAPVGSALSHRISTELLKKIFGIFLLVVGIKMLIF